MKTLIEKLGWRDHVEISDLKTVLYARSTEEILEAFKYRDLFILWWVKKWLKKRAGNQDIDFKTYFYLDFDIRSKWKELYGEVLSQQDLYREIKRLRAILSEDELLSEWSSIICSWNWAHIYYCSDIQQHISAENFRNAMKKIFHMLNKYLLIINVEERME